MSSCQEKNARPEKKLENKILSKKESNPKIRLDLGNKNTKLSYFIYTY